MVYLDNAASTRPAPEVLAAMDRTARELFANPSSAHGLGAAAARALEGARQTLAAALRATSASEVVLTSGGTEADALAVLGAAGRARGRHAVVTAIEHPAVLRSAELLAARGWELTQVAPERSGTVGVDAVLGAVRPDTALVAVMLVNNELGTVQPVADIARALARAAAPRRGPHLHVDAVQAFGYLPLDVRELGADSLAVSAHKVHGPKGVGALWVRPGAALAPLWDGGRQERGLRSGTENLAGAVGFAEAARLAVAARADTARRLAFERDRLEREIVAAVPGARLTVAGVDRAPHVSSLTFPDLPAEPLLHALEAREVYASAGSACASRAHGPSHVLKAIGVRERDAVLRFSLGRETTAAEIDQAIAAVAAAASEIAPVANRRR